MTDKTISTLQAMAWQRAKGELLGYLETFWPDYGPGGKEIDNGYDAAKTRINAFIEDFEGHCR